MALEALKTPLWPGQHFLGERIVRQNATARDEVAGLRQLSMLGNKIGLHNAVAIYKNEVIPF